MARIQVAADAEDLAIAGLLGSMLESNLEQKPEKLKDFKKLKAKISFVASDIDVAVTFDFRKGKATVHEGIDHCSKLVISADTMTLMDLANIKIVAGLPWYFDAVGRGVMMKLLTRKFQVIGLLTHPILLIRISRVMSVA